MKRETARTTAAQKTKRMVYIALFAALTACVAQISIPMPSGVPLTLQTFAIAFAGFFLGCKYGFAAIGVYVLLGVVGAPVFANFTGGVQKLVGVTGGFIWGFLLLAAFSGATWGSRYVVTRVASGLLGLIICHLAGILQYALVTGNGWGASALAVSVPYLAKDILSVILAYKAAEVVSKRLANPLAEGSRAHTLDGSGLDRRKL